jgi:hypothetical protein
VKRLFFLILVATFYYVDVSTDGTWREWSEHTQYPDADRQAGIFVHNGIEEDKVRVRQSTVTEPSPAPVSVKDPYRKNRPVMKEKPIGN